ncbi:hypothetical protein HDV00_000266 [Rhizophlyctis rosea]|nr:hypothetical protein HDV00_000266 [Rhizophlyctis rosea]
MLDFLEATRSFLDFGPRAQEQNQNTTRRRVAKALQSWLKEAGVNAEQLKAVSSQNAESIAAAKESQAKYEALRKEVCAERERIQELLGVKELTPLLPFRRPDPGMNIVIATPSEFSSSKTFLEEAKTHFAEQKYSQSDKATIAAIKTLPSGHDDQTSIAIDYIDDYVGLGMVEQALRWSYEVEQFMPFSPTLNHKRAWMLHRMGRDDEAVKILFTLWEVGGVVGGWEHKYAEAIEQIGVLKEQLATRTAEYVSLSKEFTERVLMDGELKKAYVNACADLDQRAKVVTDLEEKLDQALDKLVDLRAHRNLFQQNHAEAVEELDEQRRLWAEVEKGFRQAMKLDRLNWRIERDALEGAWQAKRAVMEKQAQADRVALADQVHILSRQVASLRLGESKVKERAFAKGKQAGRVLGRAIGGQHGAQMKEAMDGKEKELKDAISAMDAEFQERLLAQKAEYEASVAAKEKEVREGVERLLRGMFVGGAGGGSGSAGLGTTGAM